MSYQGSQKRGGPRDRTCRPVVETQDIRFGGDIDPELFNTIARKAARAVAKDGDRPRRANKPSQLRKFYDELCMWEAKARGAGHDRFGEYLPFIRMLNAKAAYAEGRELVDCNYSTLLSHCLNQVQDPPTMTQCKLFMEAFMGFYKQERPKD